MVYTNDACLLLIPLLCQLFRATVASLALIDLSIESINGVHGRRPLRSSAGLRVFRVGD